MSKLELADIVNSMEELKKDTMIILFRAFPELREVGVCPGLTHGGVLFKLNDSKLPKFFNLFSMDFNREKERWLSYDENKSWLVENNLTMEDFELIARAVSSQYIPGLSRIRSNKTYSRADYIK